MKKLVYGTACVVLAVISVLLAVNFLGPLLALKPAYTYYPIIILIGLVMAALGLLLAPHIFRLLEKLIEKIVTATVSLSPPEIISCVVGLIAGLIIASLIGAAVARISVIGPYLAILAVLVLGYVGLIVGYTMREGFANLFSRKDSGESREKPEKPERKGKGKAIVRAVTPKILDTSVIIDGRIADIYRSGFLEGELVVANFVLEELRHIADSSDSLKRNRGRSGLDCLNQMREEFAGTVVVSEKDYPDIAEVDSKLLRLAQDLQGVVVTNDFNLNKVAQLQGMKVLNINALSNAVKPVVLPGEEMVALVIKEGKEAGQGVAYLDDGTMIVVENGRRYVGRKIYVIVTSILQTSAGRMVFARPKLNKSGEVISGEGEE